MNTTGEFGTKIGCCCLRAGGSAAQPLPWHHPLGLSKLLLVAPKLVRPTLIVAAGCPIFVPAGLSPGR
eukprot:COSAG01_NODE_12254_length_1773_cov_1.281362_2_plen_67_part_01